MKLLGGLYLIWLLGTSAVGAYLASDAFCWLALSDPGRAGHPILVDALQAVMFVPLFFQGLLVHLRIPGNSIVGLGLLMLVGILIGIVHFLIG